MARYVGGALSAGAGSTTLPLMSLYAAAATGAKAREVGVFNTTATALAIKLIRCSTTGTQGSAITKVVGYDPTAPASQCGVFNTHTVTPTQTDLGYRAVLGAQVGAGIVWTFGDTGLIVAAGTGNGVAVEIENGTGQICQIYWVWDE